MNLYRFNLFITTFLIINCIEAHTPKVEGDLDLPATGYIYRSDGNGPATFIRLGDQGGQYLAEKALDVVPSIYSIPTPQSETDIRDDLAIVNQQEEGVSPYRQIYTRDYPSASFYHDRSSYNIPKHSLYSQPESFDQHLRHDFNDGVEDDSPSYQHNHSDDSEKGGGSDHDSSYHSIHDSKDEKGYKNYHDHDKGDKGHFKKDGHSGHYAAHSGHKDSHHSSDGKYGSENAGSHGKKGSEHAAHESHKKGHKTTGYHTVFHKDEYKKEHKFYDDSHKNGHDFKFGDHNEHHDKKHGSHHKGGHRDAAYKEDHKDHKGHYSKGHQDQATSTHKGKSGHDTRHDHYSDYKNKSAHKDSKEYNYKKS